jgi:hypothetical protein
MLLQKLHIPQTCQFFAISKESLKLTNLPSRCVSLRVEIWANAGHNQQETWIVLTSPHFELNWNAHYKVANSWGKYIHLVATVLFDAWEGLKEMSAGGECNNVAAAALRLRYIYQHSHLNKQSPARRPWEEEASGECKFDTSAYYEISGLDLFTLPDNKQFINSYLCVCSVTNAGFDILERVLKRFQFIPAFQNKSGYCIERCCVFNYWNVSITFHQDFNSF